MFAKVLSAVSAAAILLAASVAHADEPTPSPDAETKAEGPTPKTESRWYGYQTLASDAAAVALFAMSAGSDSEPVSTTAGVLGLATYAVAPAIIHGVHGHPGKAVGDTAIRVLTPVLGVGIGAIVGAALYTPSNDESVSGTIVNAIGAEVAILEGALIGGLVGVGTAVALDAAVLAREDVPVEKKESSRPIARAKTGPTFHPSAGPARGGFMAGLGGTF